MLNLAIMIPSWMMTLLLFQFTYLHQLMTQAFSNITPARIHQTLEMALINDAIELYLSPIKTSNVIEAMFADELEKIDIPYTFTFHYFSQTGESDCLAMCWSVDIYLSYSIYDFELASYVRYDLQRNEN
jgi:hypothetical protein